MSRNSRLSRQDYFFAFFRLVAQPFFAASDFDNGFFFATVFFFIAAFFAGVFLVATFLDVAIFITNETLGIEQQ